MEASGSMLVRPNRFALFDLRPKLEVKNWGQLSPKQIDSHVEAWAASSD